MTTSFAHMDGARAVGCRCAGVSRTTVIVVRDMATELAAALGVLQVPIMMFPLYRDILAAASRYSSEGVTRRIDIIPRASTGRESDAHSGVGRRCQAQFRLSVHQRDSDVCAVAPRAIMRPSARGSELAPHHPNARYVLLGRARALPLPGQRLADELRFPILSFSSTTRMQHRWILAPMWGAGLPIGMRHAESSHIHGRIAGVPRKRGNAEIIHHGTAGI